MRMKRGGVPCFPRVELLYSIERSGTSYPKLARQYGPIPLAPSTSSARRTFVCFAVG